MRREANWGFWTVYVPNINYQFDLTSWILLSNILGLKDQRIVHPKMKIKKGINYPKKNIHFRDKH